MFAGQTICSFALENDRGGTVGVDIFVVARTTVNILRCEPQKSKEVAFLGGQRGKTSHNRRKVIPAHVTSFLVKKEGNLTVTNDALLL